MTEKDGQYANKSSPEPVRGTKKTVQFDADSLGMEGTGQASQGTQGQSIRDGRTDSTRGNNNSTISPCIAKKILDQLIADTRDQLAKSRECIDWYIREADEYEAKLDSLNELRALAESNDQDQTP
ncbi:MAG: hypothetical protein SAJ12_07320 [Jaaginema sp. PMC 1079.18]|nr:hypothetical protein [Jaaginema sp. PMC 1080.18]MEC4850807.1 hypothetical protein [Jaaginema sp. PMC 1079.18]MEC4868178.1 hypothetical protein [Jaaginema sp. PMC 1078.18]